MFRAIGILLPEVDFMIFVTQTQTDLVVQLRYLSHRNLEITMKVFLSSTYLDLIEYRKSAAEALARLGHHVIGMETFNARTEDPTITSLKEVDECELFIGIYAYRYGSIIKDAKISVTEQEFDRAVEMEKEIFAFFLADTPSPELIDKNNEQTEKLNAFKTKTSGFCTRSE